MLREMTERTGCLHEAQVLQIRLWPFAVDPSLDTTHADVDLEKRSLTYHWEAKNASTVDKNYRHRLNELSKSVDLLLGPSWAMDVRLNGVSIFSRSPRQAPPRDDFDDIVNISKAASSGVLSRRNAAKPQRKAISGKKRSRVRRKKPRSRK
jgi:hypothetical protein